MCVGVGLGCGAGELVDGDGAGAELGGVLGGVSVAEGDELLADGLGDPDPLGVALGVGELDGAVPACTVGCGPAARARRWRCLAGEWEAVPLAEASADGCVLGTPAVWLTVWAGAVRANSVARPTAVTALS